MKKVIIAGSRNFNNYELLKTICDQLITKEFVIISGCAKGADKLGELYGLHNNIKIEKYPANWNLYGKSAGYIRNKLMAENATHCICFWNGESKGTKNMIDLAKQYNLKLKIIDIKS